jgi:osmotically inducible protein OsmC
MPVRQGRAEWKGDVGSGQGSFSFGQGEWAYRGSYSSPSRFESGEGTNPEELIGAAHAGCFSMAFAGALTRAGHVPESIDTLANVHLEKKEAGWTITHIVLETSVSVSGIDEGTFQEVAQTAKRNCPVSRALAGVDISLKAVMRAA